MSATHWPNGVSCLLANWDQLLIFQLTSAAHWPTDISCFAQVLLSAHWLTVVVSCLTANQYQLFIGLLTSAALYLNVNCSLCHWCHLLIGQLKSDFHCSIYISCSLANYCQMLIGQLVSAASWPTSDSFLLTTLRLLLIGQVSCMFADLHQLLIGQLMPAAHWPSYISCLLANITSAAHCKTDISFSLTTLNFGVCYTITSNLYFSRKQKKVLESRKWLARLLAASHANRSTASSARATSSNTEIMLAASTWWKVAASINQLNMCYATLWNTASG